MNRIERLLEEMCPEGVDYKSLNELCTKPKYIKWSEIDSSEFIYIDLESVDRDLNKICDVKTINKEDAPSRAKQIVETGDILFGTTRPLLRRYCIIKPEYDRQICSTGFCVLRPSSNKIINNYLYHHITTDEFFKYIEKVQKGASYPAVSDIEVRKYRIPVPPLPIQHEIVSILDKFHSLTSSLTDGLPAELAARRKQYEYYRDKLLTFKEKING